MTHLSRILEHLEDIAPDEVCDDCLSEAIGIKPRQAVNQACRKLGQAGKIVRWQARCSVCRSTKLVNRHSTQASSARPAAVATPRPPDVPASPAQPPDVDIEQARTAVVRLVLSIWRRHFAENPPRGPAALIVQLRNEAILPTHIANMMHTVCGLRNVHVYEEMPLDANAMTIAAAALAIISEWAEEQGLPVGIRS